jgi:hypothetical protein
LWGSQSWLQPAFSGLPLPRVCPSCDYVRVFGDHKNAFTRSTDDPWWQRLLRQKPA